MGEQVLTSGTARAVGINHVAIEVDDVNAALEFYGGLFALSLRGRVPGMAFVDMGDQFLALAERRTRGSDGHRHFGLVVDDRAAIRRALERMGVATLPGPGLDFLDPWGNRVQVVEYNQIQFTKAPQVLRAMGLEDLRKSDRALRELADKGIGPE